MVLGLKPSNKKRCLYSSTSLEKRSWNILYFHNSRPTIQMCGVRIALPTTEPRRYIKSAKLTLLIFSLHLQPESEHTRLHSVGSRSPTRLSTQISIPSRLPSRRGSRSFCFSAFQNHVISLRIVAATLNELIILILPTSFINILLYSLASVSGVPCMIHT